MNIDKFFTDLAAYANVDNVTVSVWPDHRKPIEVTFWRRVGEQHYVGDADTVDAALAIAMGKLRDADARRNAALDTLIASDADLVGDGA
jgi:hypothetical protein